MADVRQRLRDHLFRELIPIPVERWPGDGDDLFEMGLDSVRVMRLLVFIEEELNVRIPDESVTPETLGSVDRLVALVAAQG